jgi:hypothetical protein
MSRRASKRISEEVLNFGSILKWDQAEAQMGQIVAQEFNRVVETKILAWSLSLIEGNNRTYNETVRRRVEIASRRLVEYWQDVSTDGPAMLEDIEVPALSGVLSSDPLIAAHSGNAAKQLDLSIYERLGIGNSIAAAIAGSLGAAFVLISGGPATWVVAAVGLIVVALGSFFFGGPREAIETKIAQSLQQSFRKSLAEDRSKFEEQFAPRVAFFREHYLTQFHNNVKYVSDTLERRVEESTNHFSLAQAERDKIASESRRYREDSVEPLRRDIQDFVASVRAIEGR